MDERAMHVCVSGGGLLGGGGGASNRQYGLARGRSARRRRRRRRKENTAVRTSGEIYPRRPTPRRGSADAPGDAPRATTRPRARRDGARASSRRRFRVVAGRSRRARADGAARADDASRRVLGFSGSRDEDRVRTHRGEERGRGEAGERGLARLLNLRDERFLVRGALHGGAVEGNARGGGGVSVDVRTSDGDGISCSRRVGERSSRAGRIAPRKRAPRAATRSNARAKATGRRRDVSRDRLPRGVRSRDVARRATRAFPRPRAADEPTTAIDRGSGWENVVVAASSGNRARDAPLGGANRGALVRDRGEGHGSGDGSHFGYCRRVVAAKRVRR